MYQNSVFNAEFSILLYSDLSLTTIFMNDFLIVCLKGTQMDPTLVLICPSFRENVIVTCRIVSFLCSLDNCLLKNVIIFFVGNQISKWRSFEKRAIFDLLFTFFSHQRKDTKIPTAHISHTYTYFAHPIDFFFFFFFALPILKKITNLSCIVSLWCDSRCWFFFAPFWSNQ